LQYFWGGEVEERVGGKRAADFGLYEPRKGSTRS
jgi:hypothetical protein